MRVRVAASILACMLLVSASATALEFTAVADGGWKDPATWGYAGYARDLLLPGLMPGRDDDVVIPAGITVYCEGSLHAFGLKDAAKEKAATLIVIGELRGTTSTSRISVDDARNVRIDRSGVVGGSRQAPARNPISVRADSLVEVEGKVYSPGGRVDITAGKGVVINGSGPGPHVGSGRRSVHITATAGDVTVAAGCVVAAGGTGGEASVWINAGPRRQVNVQGRVEAGKDIHINTLMGTAVAGNVVIGPQAALVAKGEVKIRADTLRVQGRIEGDTVQKTCKVLIIEGSGTIVQTANASRQITNKAYDSWRAEQRQQAEAAEQAKKVKTYVPAFCLADMSSAAGTVLEGEDLVRVAGGPGSTLDLTGNAPGTPVIRCPGPIEIAVENVLLDPGVVIEDLCGPGPVLVGPPAPTVSPVCIADSDTTAYAGRTAVVRFRVENMGFAPEVYVFSWEDSLGWAPAPDLPPILLDGAADPSETLLTFPVDVPPWVEPDLDTNRIWLGVRSLSNPFEEYRESVLLPVGDVAELKDIHVALWGVNPAPGGSVMGVEHWLANNGELEDEFAITVTNREGWAVLPLAPTVFMPAGSDLILTSLLAVPPGTPDGFPNEVYISAASLGSPAVSFTDTVAVRVNVVADAGGGVPAAGVIRHAAHPNPFNPQVTITFSVPASGAQATVTVFDVSGRRVRELYRGPVGADGASCTWDGTDADGRAVGSGVYFYRIAGAGRSATGKVVLAR